MKIESIGITALEDGSRVIIAVKLDAREELEQTDVARIFAIAREIGGGSDIVTEQATRDTAPQQEPGEGVTDPTPPILGPDMGAPTTRRRRHVNPLDTAGEAAPSAQENPTPASSEPTSTPPTRRATGADASQATTTDAPAASITSEPVTRRRRAVAPVAAEPASDATAQAPAAEPVTRRRRASTAATLGTADAAITNAPPSDGSEISDTDLSKAASAAAVTILPKGVMEILGHYDCKAVGELPAKSRRKFLADLKYAVAQAA